MLKLCVMVEFLVLWLRIGTIYEERKNSVDDYDLDYAKNLMVKQAAKVFQVSFFSDCDLQGSGSGHYKCSHHCKII